MKKLILTAAIAAYFIVPAQAYLDCGRVAARLTHTTCGTALARDWARNCRHTTLHAGAVVVSSRRGHDSAGHRGGHVALVVSVIDNCHARVHDEKGIYERDVCRNQIAVVEP